MKSTFISLVGISLAILLPSGFLLGQNIMEPAKGGAILKLPQLNKERNLSFYKEKALRGSLYWYTFFSRLCCGLGWQIPWACLA